MLFYALFLLPLLQFLVNFIILDSYTSPQSCTGLPKSIQQQGIPAPAEQQPLLMAAVPKPYGLPQSFHSNMHQAPYNSVPITAQNWGRISYQTPGMTKQVCSTENDSHPFFTYNQTSKFLTFLSSHTLDGKHATCTL